MIFIRHSIYELTTLLFFSLYPLLLLFVLSVLIVSRKVLLLAMFQCTYDVYISQGERLQNIGATNDIHLALRQEKSNKTCNSGTYTVSLP